MQAGLHLRRLAARQRVRTPRPFCRPFRATMRPKSTAGISVSRSRLSRWGAADCP